MENFPRELFEGCPAEDRAARVGRWAILGEMGFFGDKTNLKLARGEYQGSFIGAIRKRFNGVYGDVRGCEPADIEVAAEMLGVFDDVFDPEVQRLKNIGDKHGRTTTN